MSNGAAAAQMPSGVIVDMAAVPFIGFLTATLIKWDPDRLDSSSQDADPVLAAVTSRAGTAEELHI